MASPRSAFSKLPKKHRQQQQQHMGISTSTFLGTSISLAASTSSTLSTSSFSPSTSSDSSDIVTKTKDRKGMPPRRPVGTEFPAGEQQYRSARQLCALACQRYNLQPEDNDPAERSRLFLEILYCNRSLSVEPSPGSTSPPLDQSTNPLPNGTTSHGKTPKTTAKACEPSASAKSSSLAAAVVASTRRSSPGSPPSKPIGRGITTNTLAGIDGTGPGAAAVTGVRLLSSSPDETSKAASDLHLQLESSTRTTIRADAIPFELQKSASANSLQSLISAQEGGVNISSTHASCPPQQSTNALGIIRGNRFPGQGVAPYIKPPLYIDYGSKLEIGSSTFINRNCTILDNPIHPIRIGERCMIGPNFSIYAIGHPVDSQLREGPSGAPSYAHSVTIGDDCWVGGNVTILGGVRIGKGCTIGANSLVTRDIPAHHLAFGVPARVIRRVSTSFPNSGLDPNDKDDDCFSIAQDWVTPEWIDSLTYRRVLRIGGHDFVAIELIVAVLVALVTGMLVKMIFIG